MAQPGDLDTRHDRAATGKLRVESDPPGADITIQFVSAAGVAVYRRVGAAPTHAFEFPDNTEVRIWARMPGRRLAEDAYTIYGGSTIVARLILPPAVAAPDAASSPRRPTP